MMRLPLRFGIGMLLLPLLLPVSCMARPDVYETADAWSEIYTAIDYKEKECGQKPGYLLIVPENPPTYGTQLCSISIIRQECPFHDYPLFCLEMLEVDLPLIGP